jgi:asparagine N-glycosylation enzyme membrane subunit Stt3
MIIDMFKRADSTGTSMTSTTTDTLYGADRPSPAGAIAFLDMFCYALVYTSYRLYHRRNGAPNIIGASFLFLGTPLLEIVGFGIRLPSLNNPNNLAFFMANQIILGFGPLYLTAVNYIVFSSLVFSVGERFSAWRCKTMLVLTIVFICQLLHLEIRGNALKVVLM